MRQGSITLIKYNADLRLTDVKNLYSWCLLGSQFDWLKSITYATLERDPLKDICYQIKIVTKMSRM